MPRPRSDLPPTYRQVELRIEKWIDSNMGVNPLKLDNFVSVDSVSKRTAYRVLEAFGYTWRGMVRSRQLRKARKMILEDTDVELAEVAKACGFSQAGHFSRTFKDRFGMTPSEYRHRAQIGVL